MSTIQKPTPMPPSPQSTDKIPTWAFARDLWEAMRSESRDQLGDTVTDEEFSQQLPPWDQLSAEVRRAKTLIARDELLKVLNRAGYEVRRRKL